VTALPASRHSTKETIYHFDLTFNSFGFPQELVTDRGTAFSSHEFTEYLQNKNIYHRLVAVAAPWGD